MNGSVNVPGASPADLLKVRDELSGNTLSQNEKEMIHFLFLNAEYKMDMSKTISKLGEVWKVSVKTVKIYDDFSYGEYAGDVTCGSEMTWAEFCDSFYNTQGFYCSDGNVYGAGGNQLYIMGTTDAVSATELVGEFEAYEYV